MTNYEFNVLSLDEQAQTIWDNGTHISHRTQEGLKINFYALFDFYAEVQWNEETNAIEKIVTFKTGDKLDYYLSKIDLKKILKK